MNCKERANLAKRAKRFIGEPRNLWVDSTVIQFAISEIDRERRRANAEWKRHDAACWGNVKGTK